ncbi:hypothetical protein RR46_08878 [Papilio xuthus]|uniref:Uncharacterized protein n=1 Tax=Papilio xuthus TaxID=66420 RepID=A0A194PRP2_PAPXU|nr:hypothetical protein RR46_08878 [Papilio xuthus]
MASKNSVVSINRFSYCVWLIKFVYPTGDCSSLLCGRTKEVEVGGNAGAGAALALSLSRPPSAGNATCQLRLTAPEAAAFTVRLIDVKDLHKSSALTPEPPTLM